MEKDNKIILGAVLIMLVSMISFNLNNLTGWQVNEGLPDLTGDAQFIDEVTGEEIYAAYVGARANIQVKIKNEGTGDAPPGDKVDKTKYRFEIKVDGKKTEDRNLKKTFSLTNTLHPQDFAVKNLRQITPIDFYQFNSVGEHCVDVKVDTSKKVAEIDEENDFLDAACVTVVEEGKPLPKKEEAKVSTAKKKKIKPVQPTDVQLELLEYYTNEKGGYVEVLVKEEECELEGTLGVSCTFKANLEGPSAGANDGESWKNYIVRARTTTNSWKVRHASIVYSDSNKVFLTKACSTYLCELRTGDMLKTETKDNQYIKSGEYIIAAIAELSK
ncbi:MAG: CARDB domain-containing protein [Nanoarchaeota archaeon]